MFLLVLAALVSIKLFWIIAMKLKAMDEMDALRENADWDLSLERLVEEERRD